jgi:hypothetical protein
VRHVGLRDVEALRQGREGAGGGLTEGAAGGQQRRQEDMHPLSGCALDHAEQASRHPLERRGLEGGAEEAQPLFRCRQGAVLLDGKLAGGAGLPIEAPRRLAGRDQGRKRLGEAYRIADMRNGFIEADVIPLDDPEKSW